MRETVLAAIETKLETLLAEPLSWPLVRRNYPGRVAAAQCPAALMFDGGETAQDYVSCQVQIEMPVEIDVLVRASDSDGTGPEFSERLAELKALFMADETLNGTVTRVRYQGCTDPVLDEEMGGSPLVIATTTFLVLFEHRETNPYLAA